MSAHVQVVVSLETLLGLNDDAADLTGHGPVTAQTARDLAFNAGSTWRRLVTDPVHGYLLNYGRSTYRPPKPLAEHCRARDYTCRSPNCDRPAAKCDLDHVINWPAGDTSDTNLACDCERCHRMKHEGRWQHRLSTDPDHPPGTIIMISPTEHVYLSYPHDYDDLRPKSPPRKDTTPTGGETDGSFTLASAGGPGPAVVSDEHRPVIVSDEHRPPVVAGDPGPPPF